MQCVGCTEMADQYVGGYDTAEREHQPLSGANIHGGRLCPADNHMQWQYAAEMDMVVICGNFAARSSYWQSWYC
jgi:hypothetical protein